MATKMKTRLTLEQVQQIQLPGFTMIRKDEPSWRPGGEPTPELHFENAAEGVTIRISFWKDGEWMVASGHTDFDTAQGRKTFDRRGIDDSFYVEEGQTLEQVAETMNEQLEKVKASRERIANSVPVPGLPGSFLVTPEKREEISKLLNAGKTHSFTPGGMGTGYQLYTGRRQSHFDSVAPKQLREFFGVTKALFYRMLDCD